MGMHDIGFTPIRAVHSGKDAKMRAQRHSGPAGLGAYVPLLSFQSSCHRDAGSGAPPHPGWGICLEKRGLFSLWSIARWNRVFRRGKELGRVDNIAHLTGHDAPRRP